MTRELFAVIREGVVRPETGLVLPLRDAADAHRVIESRRVAGAIVLRP